MWALYLFSWGFGAAFLVMTLVRIIQMKRCTEIVNGWFLETVRIIRIKNSTTKAKFFYEYDGKEYHSLTDLGITLKRMNELSKGYAYRLYVNPKNPSKFAFDKKLTLRNEIVPLVCAAFFFVFPIALNLVIEGLLRF